MTTYAVLESAFRKQQSGFKRGGRIIKEKSPVHQITWNRIIVSGYCAISLGPLDKDTILCSLTRHIISRSAALTLLKRLSSSSMLKLYSTAYLYSYFLRRSVYKWCLSGTPLQNRVGELYSLVRFLGGDPFSFYFCKSNVK